MSQLKQSGLVLDPDDIDIIENVFDYGPELLEADNADDAALFAFDPLTTELVRALHASAPIRAKGLHMAVYCLSLAKDVISGKLAVDPSIRAALSPDVFDVNRIHARFSAALDTLGKSKRPSSSTFGISDNLTFPDSE